MIALQAVHIPFSPFLRPAPPSFEISEPVILGKASYLYEHIGPKVGYSASNGTYLDDGLTLSIALALGEPSSSAQGRRFESL